MIHFNFTLYMYKYIQGVSKRTHRLLAVVQKNIKKLKQHFFSASIKSYRVLKLEIFNQKCS
jgi:hypothetical protein